MAKLYFNYAAMNAGKSTILLQSSYNYQERGMHTLLLKPAIDDREGETQNIASRIGLKAQADCFRPEDDLEKHVLASHKEKALDCVLIDEAQFLTGSQVWQLSRVSDEHRIPVMCYGLRTDFRGELFPGSMALLALADDIRELRTLCWCGKKAIMTLRIDGNGDPVTEGDQVEIGGNERYMSLCRKHWVSQQIRKT